MLPDTRKPNLAIATAFFLLTILSAAGVRAEVVGRVKTVNHPAELIRAEAPIPIGIGTEIYRDDVIETGEEGAVGITFRDETMISVGPSTRVSVDDYFYAPSDEDHSFVMRVARGTLFYVSGFIAKSAPEKVTIATPDGTVGIRGTRLAVKVTPKRRWQWPWAMASTQPAMGCDWPDRDRTFGWRKGCLGD